MTNDQQAGLISIIQFSDLTESEIETLFEFIEEVESKAYESGAESCCGISASI